MLVLVHAPELLRILMTASSTTARFLSLAVLVLSLAPLASLYVIFFSLLGVEPSSFVLVENDAAWEKNAADAMKGFVGSDGRQMDWTQIANNRTALEELWKAMYMEASRHQPNHPFWTALRQVFPLDSPLAPPATTTALQQHWSIVIPWMLTFILGVVVPMILSIWSFWRQYRRGRRGSNKKRRRKEIFSRLEGYTKQLDSKDLVIDLTSDSTDTDTSSNSATNLTDSESSVALARPGKVPQDTIYQWLLPPPGEKLRVQEEQQQQSRRIVPGSCVVCLNSYQLKEKVSWSANPSCVHCFHTDCITKWLTRQTECPCCRRAFLHKDIQ